MAKTKSIDGSYVHQLFCEAMECTPLPLENLRIFSLDEIDYFNKMQEEEIDEDNSSVYKYFEDNYIELYVNETTLNNEPFLATEILFSQLFDIYHQYIPYYQTMIEMVYGNRFTKKSQNGFDYWRQFSSSFMSTKLTKLMYGDLLDDEDFDSPYKNNQFIENLKEMLKNIKDDEDTPELKIEIILYILGKLANLEKAMDENIRNLFQVKKLTFLNISEFVEGDLGKEINNLYRTLITSMVTNPHLLIFFKIANSINKITILLTSRI